MIKNNLYQIHLRGLRNVKTCLFSIVFVFSTEPPGGSEESTLSLKILQTLLSACEDVDDDKSDPCETRTSAYRLGISIA